MTTTTQQKKRAFKDLDGVGKAIKGIVDDARVQAHLATMELERDAGPYLAALGSASKAAAKDLARRGRQLRSQLKRIKAEHLGRGPR
jgi:hypothetical protein